MTLRDGCCGWYGRCINKNLLSLELDLVGTPGRGFGRLELCTSFAAFMKSGARSHLLCARAISRSKIVQ